MPAVPQRFPVRLTQAQRKVVAEIAPELSDRLKLDERNQRTIPLPLAELKAIKEKAGKAMMHASTGMVRNSLRHVTDLAAQALDRSRGPGAIPAAERVYQFKITLLDTRPRLCNAIAEISKLAKMGSYLPLPAYRFPELRYKAPGPRSGGASRPRTAPWTSSTNTSRRRWAGRTATCTTSGSASSFTATRC